MIHRAILTADLGFGDAGKGSIVDFLTRRYHTDSAPVTVVRYNGGAQAAHNVVTPDGRHHTFAQFGAGLFTPHTRTHLSRFMLCAPPEMLAEARGLEALGVDDPFARTTLERGAAIITPFQQAANRLRELARGVSRHGSCGMGIGETASDRLNYGDQVVLAGDLSDRAATRRKLQFMRAIKREQLRDVIASVERTPAVQKQLAVFDDPALIDTVADVYAHFAEQITLVDAAYLADTLARDGVTIFEGAQGVLLDEDFGFHPYTTWSHITFANADTLLREANYAGDVFRLGIVRAYATRHGAGPFVTEDAALSAAIPDYHNGDNAWQRAFRVGWFDAVVTRYALNVIGGVDALAVTCLDRLTEVADWQICTAYRLPRSESESGLGGEVETIPLCPNPPDLDYQAQLTALLERATPIYEPYTGAMDGYLSRLEALLGARIALTSAGVTADDKHIRIEGIL
ncbi:MAG: adenylosuccinate synthetase [Chloroflexota bacterium]|nr:adenylosuccinate synthetase [Chloroflexota bacterium]